jgi:hypothetical protein
MMTQAATAALMLIALGGLVLAALAAVIGTLRVRLAWDREDRRCDVDDEAAWIAAREAALERAMAILLERNLRKAEEDRRRRAERMRQEDREITTRRTLALEAVRRQKLRRSDLARKRREIRRKRVWRELDMMMIAMTGRAVAIKEAA